MKTQMVKNADHRAGRRRRAASCSKRHAADRGRARRHAGRSLPRRSSRGLLDVTDNLRRRRGRAPAGGGAPRRRRPLPRGRRRQGHGAPSPTPPTRSSAQYGFWLGDAFASGGSHGYDHKKMGITARGAWESRAAPLPRARHRRADASRSPSSASATCPATCSATACCMSRHDAARRGLQPRAHLPRPDAGSRAQRSPSASGCSSLPRSTWRDYDRAADQRRRRDLRPRGEGDSAQPGDAQDVLGIDDDGASGEEVIRRILTRRVDLLYNGGIGTYVKASDESDADVGDRANDRVRVDADERAGAGRRRGRQPRADAEGPDRVLGCAAGCINTDAIDNSGRRRHVGPRGEHQDPPGHAAREGRLASQVGAQHAAARDDRRRVARWCSPTTPSQSAGL